MSVCDFNNNNFSLESVLKIRVRIIYGCALYTGKYVKLCYEVKSKDGKVEEAIELNVKTGNTI